MSGVSPLRAAATVIDQAAGSLRAALDHKLPVVFNRSAVFEARGVHAHTAVRQAEEAVALLRDAGPRGSSLADSMQADVEYLHRVFDGRPFQDARHSLSDGHQFRMFEIRADRARLLDELSGLDDASAQRLVEATMEAPLRRMVAGDVDAQREVALLAGVPSELGDRHLRTQIHPSVWDAIGVSRSRNVSVVGSAAFAEASAAVRRQELVRLPAASLETHVQGLLAREADSLTPHEVRELALAGTLPERPFVELDVPSLRMRNALSSLIAASPSSIDGNPARLTDDVFLREIEAWTMVRDGTAPTRQAATLEVAAILDTPLDALSPQQLHRISVLNHLPLEHRPTQPTTPSTFHFSRLGMRTGWTERPERHLRMLEDARSHFHDLRDPTAALAELRTALVTDQPFNVHRMAALLNDPVAVRAAGIDDAMVARAVTRQLQAAGTSEMKGAPLRQVMEASRERLAQRTLRPEFEQLRIDALELLDRNLSRMRGERLDTFGRHPDYAEVGRVAAQLGLLDAVDTRAATAAATSARETLTW